MSELSELRAERDRVACALAALERDPAPSNPQSAPQRSFLKHRLFVLNLAMREAETRNAESRMVSGGIARKLNPALDSKV